MILRYPDKNKINKILQEAGVYNTLRFILTIVQVKKK